MTPLLRHVLDDRCMDPDCEVHNPTVGIEEQVVSEANYAFFLAGAALMRRDDPLRQLTFALAHRVAR